MMETSAKWHRNKEKQFTVHIGIFFPLKPLKPPWFTVVCALVMNFITSVSARDKVDPSEYRHRGDLHLVRESNVHSLAWVVEIANGCSISDVIGDFRTKGFMEYNISCEGDGKLRHNQSKDYVCNIENNVLSSGKNKSVELETCCDKLVQLILIKELNFLKNVYIVAHPFFWIYSQVKRKWRDRLKRNVQRVQNNSASSLIPDNYRKFVADEVIFLRIEACLVHYFGSHPCVNYAKQEVLRPRVKRSRVEFLDPLYEEQWHLVRFLF